MAYEVSWSFSGGGGRCYNVTHSVGIGAANYTDDVMLVQFFLKRIYSHPFGLAGAPDPDLAVDGNCGPMTRRWIRAFQTQMQAMDMPPSRIRVDGRVSSASANLTSEQMHYTVVLLNRWHGKLWPDEDVRLSPDAPPYLRKSLSGSTVVGGGGV